MTAVDERLLALTRPTPEGSAADDRCHEIIVTHTALIGPMRQDDADTLILGTLAE